MAGAKLSKVSSDRPRRGGKRQGRPPAGDSELTRRRIMDAAQLCFAERGYRETSNRVIADMAHVTTGTIYHYFANKRELFLAIHQDIQADFQQRLRPVLETDMSLAESIERIFKISLTSNIEKPSYGKFNAVVRTEALRNPEIAGARVDREWRQLYREFAERGVKRGEIEKKDMRAVQAVLGSIILGLAQHSMEASLADHQECLRGLSLLFRGDLIGPVRK